MPAKKAVKKAPKRKLNAYAKFVKKHYHDPAVMKLAPEKRFAKLAKMWKKTKREVCDC